MKKTLSLLCALVTLTCFAQKTPLALENGWKRCFIPNQEVHTYNYKSRWASVTCEVKNSTAACPKVRIEFAEEKPEHLGLIYKYVAGDTVKTSYVMPSVTDDNKTYVASFLPIHKEIVDMSLFAFRPDVGIVKLKKVSLLAADGSVVRELAPIVNSYGDNIVEVIDNKYSGTIVYDRRWQSVDLTGVAGRENSTITLRSHHGFGKDIQLALVYESEEEDGKEVTDFVQIRDEEARQFSVKTRQSGKLKNAFIQITTPDCPVTFLEIDEAYIE